MLSQLGVHSIAIKEPDRRPQRDPPVAWAAFLDRFAEPAFAAQGVRVSRLLPPGGAVG